MNVGPPPVDGHGKLKSRRLAAGTVWYRIGHRRYGTALHICTGAAARWNDPLDRYGVLYLADAPATAFAETFGHDVSEHDPPATDKFVTVTELTERHLYRIKTDAALHVGLLQGAGLAALNLDVRLLATVDDALPQRWSRWVYDAPAALDGILYPSRLLPDHENTALFDRCRDRLEEEDLGTLAQWRCGATGQDILDILDAQGWGLV